MSELADFFTFLFGCIMGKQEDMIIKDIKNAFNETKKQMGMYLTFEIQQTYESVIDKFYCEFTPRFYRRTFYTYKGSNRADDHSGIDFDGLKVHTWQPV